PGPGHPRLARYRPRRRAPREPWFGGGRPGTGPDDGAWLCDTGRYQAGGAAGVAASPVAEPGHGDRRRARRSPAGRSARPGGCAAPMKLYRVRPAQRLLLLLLCLVLVACAVAIAEGIWPELDGRLSSLGGMLLALFVTLAVLDLVQARRLPPISLERLLPGSLALGQWHQARLRIQHRLTRAAAVEVFDHCPAACEAEGLPLRVELQPGKTAEIHYRLRPLTRGLAVFPGVELRIGSTFGLWDLQFYEPAQTDTRIYPNFAALARYDLLAADPNTRIGIRRGPRRGTGTEFHQLREYQTGDVLRQVDWKATSRRLQLISREYQTERDQQLVLMLDG